MKARQKSGEIEVVQNREEIRMIRSCNQLIVDFCNTLWRFKAFTSAGKVYPYRYTMSFFIFLTAVVIYKKIFDSSYYDICYFSCLFLSALAYNVVSFICFVFSICIKCELYTLLQIIYLCLTGAGQT